MATTRRSPRSWPRCAPPRRRRPRATLRALDGGGRQGHAAEVPAGPDLARGLRGWPPARPSLARRRALPARLARGGAARSRSIPPARSPAQKLLFGHSVAGDLTPLFAGFFDTTVGAKRDAASYAAIAAGAAPARRRNPVPVRRRRGTRRRRRRRPAHLPAGARGRRHAALPPATRRPPISPPSRACTACPRQADAPLARRHCRSLEPAAPVPTHPCAEATAMLTTWTVEDGRCRVREGAVSDITAVAARGARAPPPRPCRPRQACAAPSGSTC